MHKSWAILLLLLLVMLLYLVDLFFHLGYIRWFIFNILSPVKSKFCCKFPSIRPIEFVHYLAKTFIPTTFEISGLFSASQSLNSSISR